MGMGRFARELRVGTMKARRIGIFGGSFSPPHLGHLIVARQAAKTLRLDELYFVPCAKSAYGKKLWDASLRLRLLRAALRGQAGMKICDLEIRRGGISRTVDTLRALHEQFGVTVKLFLILGQDQWEKFPTWKEPDKIAKLAQIATIPRKSRSFVMWNNRTSAFPIFVDSPQIQIASSTIRERVRKGLPISLFVGKKIEEIIQKEKKMGSLD